jgi:hypothetical protein
VPAAQVPDGAMGRSTVPRNRPASRRPLNWFRPVSNPVTRTSDRLECVARVLLALSLFAAVPIALVTGTTTYRRVAHTAITQAEERRRVTVTLVDDVPAPLDEPWNNTPKQAAAAAWTDASGVEHQVSLSVPGGSRAGLTAPVWIDREGNRTTRPLTRDDVTVEAVGTAVLTLGGLSLVALGAYRSACGLLDRSRSRRWAAEWAIVEPVWSRKVS